MSDIEEAVRLLRENGYIVIKRDARMEEDADKCVEMKAKGQDKACLGCFCNVCLANR